MSNNVEVVNLNELTVPQIKELCKERGIPCYNGKTIKKKQELIDLLIAYQNNENPENKEVETVETNVVESNDNSKPLNISMENGNAVQKHLTSKIIVPDVVKSGINNVVNEPLPDPDTFCRTKNKDKYIESAEPGTLFAFLDENGKPRTGAMVNRSSKRKVVKLVTEFGWEFIIPYTKVMWVKQGDKWPHGVYRLLKEWKNVHRTSSDKQ